MRYSELIQLYFERSNALQWYWTLYVVVVGGLLAFSSLRVRRDAITGILVTVLFCFFAYKNLDAIHDVTLQRAATLQAIRSSPTNPVDAGEVASEVARTRSMVEPTLVSPDYEGTRNFHIASDLLTVAAIWAMELRRARAARSESAK